MIIYLNLLIKHYYRRVILANKCFYEIIKNNLRKYFVSFILLHLNMSACSKNFLKIFLARFNYILPSMSIMNFRKKIFTVLTIIKYVSTFATIQHFLHLQKILGIFLSSYFWHWNIRWNKISSLSIFRRFLAKKSLSCHVFGAKIETFLETPFDIL